MKLKPLGDRVVVEAIEEEKVTKSGIVIPDTATEKPTEGKIVAVGSGKLLDNGDRAKMEVKVGDIVIYSKYGGTEIKVKGKSYMILSESDIYAVQQAK